MPQLAISQQLNKLMVNILDFHANGNGTYDNGSAFAAALASIPNGGTIWLPPSTNSVANTYLTSQPIVLNAGQYILSGGYQACIIKLANGANCDLIQSANFASLTGTNSTASPYSFGLAGISLDGNNANNSAGRCISFYGYGYYLDNIRIHHAASDGMYSEWSTSSASPGHDSMEAFISNYKIHDCAGNGMVFAGPHDSKSNTCVIYNNGTTTSHANLLLPSTTNQASGTSFNDIHCWGGTGNYPVIDHDSNITFSEYAFEGGLASQFYGDNDIHLNGGRLFTGSANKITSAIVMGTSNSVQAAHSTIVGDVQDCIGGVLDVTNAGKYSTINLHVYQIHHPVNTTSSTAVSAPGTQDIVLAGGVATVIAGMSLDIDRNGVLHEVVVVNSVNSGASSINCTFANAHTTTPYTVANASLIGTPDATNRVSIHQSGLSGGLQDGTVSRIAGTVAITPASIYQTGLKINQVSGQVGPLLALLNGGTFIGGFGSNGNVAVGLSPNTTIEGLFQTQDDAHKAFVGIAHSATHSGDLWQLQDYQFNTLTRYSAVGNLAIAAPASSTTPLTVSARNTTDVVSIFEGIASQSGDLTDWRDSTGATNAAINYLANFGIGVAPGVSTELKIQARANGDHPLTVLQHSSSQTGPLFEVTKSDGTTDLYTLDQYARPIASAQYQPTVVASTGLGTSPPSPAYVLASTACDWAGNLTFGTGTGSTAASRLMVVSFANAYAATPRMVLVFPANNATAALKPFALNWNGSGFEVWVNSNPTDSKANTFYAVGWLVIG